MLPSLHDLDDAYEQGRTAAPDAKNPYFPCTPMAMQWEYGRADSGAISSVPRPLLNLTRVVMVVTTAVIVAVLVRGTLL